MKDIIALYALRYGLEDTLTDIAAGLVRATEEVSNLTQDGKRPYLDAATEIYSFRNKFRASSLK